MLDENDLKKIALNECVDMYGRDYIHAREDICCDMWGFEDNKYIYTLLTNETGMHCVMDGLKVIKDAPFDYRATVYVDANTGKVTRDYDNSVLPN